MANIKNFGIAGVSADVQMGKSGGRIVYDSGNTLFKFTQSNGSTLAKIQIADPTGATDVVTKGYLDGVSSGLDIKESVRGASTAAATLASDFENGDTMDGLTLATGDRILIKDQASGAENGIYVVAASGAPARATDADAATGELDGGSFFFVEAGTANADSGWVVTNDGTVTIGTTALTFVQFSGAGQITAGSGMTKSSNTLNVIGGTGITANANDIQIAADWTGQNTITTLGTIGTGTWQGTAVANAYVAQDLTIAGGTVNSSIIGGGTPAAGTFTTLTANTSITGTLATAAQPNVTSLGTLTALTVDNININGNAITSTDTNGNINLTPHGAGSVVISKADINSGTFDGIVGGTTPADGSFTTLSTTGTATLAGADINGGSIDGTNIGAAVVGTGAFSTVTASTSVSTDTISEVTGAAGVTIDGVQLKDSAVVVDTISEKTSANGVQIDSATIKDNTFLGNVTVEAGETLNVSAGTLTLANNQISGDAVEGGTIAAITITSLTGGGTFTGNVDVSGSTLTLAANQISGNSIDGGVISDFASTGIDDNSTGAAMSINSSNNITTTGDLTVGGDLTVSGDNVTINTATLTVEDPLSLLSSGATGSASVDAGLIVERGDDQNVAWLWDESTDYFAFAKTDDTATTAGNVTIADYANVHAGTLQLDDNLTFNANTVLTFTGNADMRMKDNDAAALNINENGASYLNFSTANGAEKITLGKKLEAGAVEIEGSNFDINGGAIDGAVIGAASAAAITGTTITASTNFAGDLTGDVTGNADTATILATARTIGGVSFNGSANIVPTTITVADTTDTTTFVGLWESATGDLLPKTDAGLTYNAGTGMLTATGFTGPLTGLASTATLATTVTASANNTTDETTYLTFVDGATGAQGVETDTGLTYNPSSGLLTTATLTTTGAATLATAKVSSLTANRVTLGGTAGLLQDSANFTFDGSTMQITGAANVTGDLDVDNLNFNGNAITSTDTNGNIDLTPHGNGEVNITKVDIAAGAIDGTVIGAASAAAGTFTNIAGTITTGAQNSITSATSLAAVGTITTGVWSGTSIVDAKVDNDLTISGGTVNASIIGAVTPAAGTFTDFTSVGIADTASTGNALTLDGDNDVVVTNNLDVGGAVTVTGNLTVNGTTTTVSTTNTTIEDNVIMLNQGESGAAITETYAGISVDRGSSANAHFVYDDGQDRWEALSGHDTIGSAALSAVAFGAVGAGTWQGTAVAGAYGGTGISTAGTTGVARLDSGTWSIGDASLTADVSGTLPVANGGTAQTSLDDITSANNLLTVGAGADTVIGGDVTLTVNQANMNLDTIGGSLGLTDQVTGVLPVANGGTGIASGTTNQFLKFTGTTTIGAGYAEDLYANDIKVFSASGATTSGAGEGVKLTNASGKAYFRSTNTAASGDVDLYLGAQGNGDVVVEGSGNGVVKGDDDLDLTVRGGDASAADAGDLILSGGNGTGGHDSGNVYIQGGLGGASNGEVQIRDASGNEILTFTETGSAVNHIKITNQATGSAPQIDAVGDDTNISLYLNPKGTGVINAPDGYMDRAGFAADSLVTKEYVDANSSIETFARRASFTANSSLTNYNIGSVLKTGTTNYVNKVVVSVTTALAGGDVAGIRLHDGTAYLTALDDCDTTATGTYVIDLPTTTSTATAAQLNMKMVQSNGTSAATPTAGVVVTTVQYVQV